MRERERTHVIWWRIWGWEGSDLWRTVENFVWPHVFYIVRPPSSGKCVGKTCPPQNREPFDTTKKMLWTGLGIRARSSTQIQFKQFLRLPSCFGEKCSRESEPATQVPATRGKFRQLGRKSKKVCKAKALPCNPCVCMCLHLTLLAHLFAAKARANICVSMGRAGTS